MCRSVGLHTVISTERIDFVHKALYKCSALILSATVLFTNMVFQIHAEPAAADVTAKFGAAQNFELPSYDTYLKSCGFEVADEGISVPLESFSATEADAVLEKDTLKWNGGKGSLRFSVDVPTSARYNIEIVWYPLEKGMDIDLGVQLDGKYLFSGMDKLELTRMWENAADKPRVDVRGNQHAPEQKEIDAFITTLLKDSNGITAEPYEFEIEAGTHSITLVEPQQAIEIKSIKLCPPEQCENYAQVSENYEITESDANIITIQGEDAAIKSSGSVVPKSNNSDAGMTPASSKNTFINYIGGTAWQSPGQTLTWNFEVEKAGYYYFNMRYKQSDLINGDSWRWLKIDGKTPFAEAKTLIFPYDSKWKYYTLGDETAPYYFWLDKGPHTITLEVTIGNQSEFFKRLSEIVNVLGDEYIKIVMITSESPDVNRDYELFNQIPDFTQTLTSCRDDLSSLVADMKAASGKRSTQSIAAMENMVRVLNSMLKSPYVAQQYVKDYYTNYTSVSSWLYDMTKMPLSVDEINIVPAGKKADDKTPGFFKRINFSAKKLLYSFLTDYSLTDEAVANGEKSIRLWVNWGQDQAAALNALIEDSFTPTTGIHVQLEIVNASLVRGILSDNYPDLALHMIRTEPVNLGIRGALCDLTQFPDCDEVLSRFHPGADIPYRYHDALYALPDTQSFFLMYYRTDILEQLGLEVPTTWDEFQYAATIIQRNNMNVYVPYTQITTSTTVNLGIGNLNLFPTLMAQNGLSIYNKELNATDLTGEKAIGVFQYWTDFYTKYDILKEADFYNRFRVGVMPLGIAPLATYFTLYSAAPEIADRWSIATVPGITDSNNSIAGSGTGCAIVEKSANKEEAWEFLKWWTSAETQARYTGNVESILGMIGRTTTSNVEGLLSLPWDKEHIKVIEKQWSRVKEVPEVPGSYYLVRALDQAYWAVVNGDGIAKDAVDKWSRVADDEIARKIKEYS